MWESNPLLGIQNKFMRIVTVVGFWKAAACMGRHVSAIDIEMLRQYIIFCCMPH